MEIISVGKSVYVQNEEFIIIRASFSIQMHFFFFFAGTLTIADQIYLSESSLADFKNSEFMFSLPFEKLAKLIF